MNSIPAATYRLQFDKNFTLENGKSLIHYLRDLGISHVYSSPLLKARSGSSHCYDVISHSLLNPEICTAEELACFVKELHQNGMFLLLDIVPNHMAADVENRMWNDLLQNGKKSRFASYFDIYWKDPDSNNPNEKIVIPILDQSLEKVIGMKKLKLVSDKECATKISLDVNGRKLPVSRQSYLALIGVAIERIKRKSDMTRTTQELEHIALELHGKGPNYADLVEKIELVANTEPTVSEAFRKTVSEINRRPGSLLRIVKDQNYELEYWLDGLLNVNYRRFFNVSDLVSIREELLNVFEEAHSLISKLCKRGMIDGLRIDHPDGLWDPKRYFERLQSTVKKSIFDTDTYVAAEKIISFKREKMRQDWPVSGTTGYDFLNVLNGIFVDKKNHERLIEIYSNFTGDKESFDQVSFDSKMLIIQRFMQPDVDQLTQLLLSSIRSSRKSKEISSFRKGIELFAAYFPVYRTYIEQDRIPSNVDRKLIQEALRLAEDKAEISKIPTTGINEMKKLLELISQIRPKSERYLAARRFFMKFQQVSPAISAKGIEDTAFYRQFPLVSLNEVGGDPKVFGTTIDEFHLQNKERLEKWPGSMLATSTHDTKRSEDVRARINILSEMPEEWSARIDKWHKMNNRFRTKRNSPSKLYEYLLYQIVVGSIEFSDVKDGNILRPEYIKRIIEFMRKASKEAKLETSWIFPDEVFDKTLEQFVLNILSARNRPFISDLLKFSTEFRAFGNYNSLSQLVLKLTCPGVPDFYQGMELWDYSLVDPDNRRPVDFEKRKNILQHLKKRMKTADAKRVASSLLKNSDNGIIKLFTTLNILNYRRANGNLFSSGDYFPLDVHGEKNENVCGFMRIHSDKQIIVLVSRFFFDLCSNGSLPIGDCWKNTTAMLPDSIPRKKRLRNVLTEEELTIDGNEVPSLSMAKAFKTLPVAVIEVI